MKRVVLIVVLVGIACLAGAFWYFRTCCAPPPTDVTPRPGVTTRNAPASTPASSTPSAPDGATASKPAAAKRSRAAAPTPATPAAPETPAAPTTATLRIVSDVAEAQVFLNRAFIGAAPATASDLKPGSYQLNVAAPGFDNHVETVELTPGEREIVIKFREVRLNASLDVVHSHRFGSCKGQLVATPQGLRYETTDKDDAFVVPLLELETFQVDYLNKNLRIEPRKGKRYDFTDPEGNADRLFVFHRDVDRARERLRVK